MRLAHKFRLYPTPFQQTQLSNQFGANRWIYNYFIDYSWKQYEETGKTPSHISMCYELPKLKQEHPWLKEAQAQSFQNTLKNLHSAFTRVKKKQGGPPNYKSRFNRQSVGYPQGSKIDGNRIYLPKIGWVRFRGLSDNAEYKGGTITVSLDRDNRYYASFSYELHTNETQNTDDLLGLDMGIKDLITTSKGEKINGNDIIENYDIQEQLLELKVKGYQKTLSRRTKGSNRREKTRLRLARSTSKLKRFRLDMIHKLTHQLIEDNEGLAIEDLHVKGMKANKKLGPSIHKLGWGEFRRQLEYKSELHGKEIIIIDRWFPSSKTCSSCGVVNEELTLGDREWTCSECGVMHDRDINAAINIKERGQWGSLSSINIARGENVRPEGYYQAVSTKREDLVEIISN